MASAVIWHISWSDMKIPHDLNNATSTTNGFRLYVVIDLWLKKTWPLNNLTIDNVNSKPKRICHPCNIWQITNLAPTAAWSHMSVGWGLEEFDDLLLSPLLYSLCSKCETVMCSDLMWGRFEFQALVCRKKKKRFYCDVRVTTNPPAPLPWPTASTLPPGK